MPAMSRRNWVTRSEQRLAAFDISPCVTYNLVLQAGSLALSSGCNQRHSVGNWSGLNERRLQGMVQFVLSKIEALMQTARDNYSVDPVVFLVIYLVSGPFFYYSLFRMIRALAKKLGKEVMLWSAIFLCANVAPFLYVLLFGRNLPWWVYGIIALLIGQGVFSLVMKLRGKPAASSTK